ncbi:MAG TPA: FUSC family protein, partial [Bacillota bacterium]|nr:FUSC family protein [Bacillota bacterium]
MRRWLLQGQAVKTAVAATLAWAVGTLVPGVTRPYFAPLAAILTVQVSVAASLKRAVQRTLGVVVGVLLALLLSHLVGLTAWGVGVLVLVSLTVGAWLRLGPTGAPQVAVSALLVLIVGALSGPAYAWQRAVETAIGAAVGVAVGALLVPPSDVPAARKSLQALATDLAECLDRMAGGGEGLAEARHLTRQAEAARAAIGRAEESLLYNVWAGRQRAELDQFRSAFAALEHTAIQVRGIARALH